MAGSRGKPGEENHESAKPRNCRKSIARPVLKNIPFMRASAMQSGGRTCSPPLDLLRRKLILIYLYIYIYRERERDTSIYVIYEIVVIIYIYIIYIYILFSGGVAFHRHRYCRWVYIIYHVFTVPQKGYGKRSTH